MPFNGAGVFSRTPGTRIANQGALVSAQVNDETDNLVNGVNGKLNLDGLLAMTGNLPLAGAGTAALHAASVRQVQSGTNKLATVVAGTVDAITITMAPVTTAWTTGETFDWLSGGANTITTPTINKDGVAAKTIVDATGAALAVAALGVSGVRNTGYYDGTNVRLTSANIAGAALLASANVFTNTNTFVRLNLTGQQIYTEQALTVTAGAADWNMALGVDALASTAVNLTMNAPTNVVSGSRGTLRIFNTSGAQKTITWNAAFSYLQGTLPTIIPSGNSSYKYWVSGASIIITSIDILTPATGHAVVVKTSGTSYTTPVGCTQISVEVIGGGNTGGAGVAAQGGGGGGGGGGYAKKLYTVVSNTAYTYAVGAAGGGNSTFTDGVTLITGNGGTVGAVASATNGAAGGAGGTGTNGDINLSGGKGASTVFASTNGNGGNGGNAGGMYGQGGGGAAANTTGFAGASYGGGGGGGGATSNSAGGAGAAGAVIITEYY